MLNKLVTRIKGLNSPPPILFLASAIFLIVAYSWKVGSVTSGMSPAEAANIANSHSLHTLYAHPLNAPHNFFIYLLGKTHHAGLTDYRLVSVAWGLVFIGCFYKISRSWFGSFIGWLTTMIFATTPLVILAARSATADIMYLMPVAVAAGYFSLSRGQRLSRLTMLGIFLMIGLALYTPGSLWLFIAGLVAIRSSISKLLAPFGRWNWLGYLVFLAALAPLAISLINSPALVKDWLLLPGNWHPLALLKSVGWMAAGLVWHTAQHNDLQIARLPVLGSVQVILAALGTFALWKRATLKTLGLASVTLIGVVGAGLSGQIGPLLFSLVALSTVFAAGLRYLHIEWQGVFPRNPLPRNFALLLLCSIVAFNVFYGLRYSLVAWPHNVATRQTYVLK